MKEQEPTPKKPSMKEIAKKLNISINAVSLALNDRPGVSSETRVKVMNLAEEIGYLTKKKKFLRTFVNNSICVIVNDMYKEMHFYAKMLVHIESAARNHSLHTVLGFFDEKNQSLPDIVTERKVFGVIVVGMVPYEYLKALRQYSKNIVLLDFRSYDLPLDCVLSDNKKGGFISCQYLLEKGFRKIGFFGDLDYSESIRERYMGYCNAIQAQNDEKMVSIFLQAQTYSILSGLEQYVIKNDVKAIVDLLETIVIPEAFVCSNDNAAFVLMNALHMMQYRVPEDVSVMGFDDTPLCHLIYPNISTIRVNAESMCKTAVARLLYKKSSQLSIGENMIIGVELVERGTVRGDSTI